MTRPLIICEIAFGSNLLTAISSTVWTDVSADVLIDPSVGGGPISIRRGRQSDLDRIEAGALSLTLDNRTRRYDSEYTSGPYYPNIVPMRRIRIMAIWNSVLYYLFTGYISAWAPAYPGGQAAVVRITASDAFNLIARAIVTYTGNEFINWAILSILTLIGWPSLDYVYDGAKAQVPTGSYTHQNPLQLIQSLIDAENGLFFIQANGKARFQDRQWRIRNASSLATFGTGAGELPYLDVAQSYDEQLLYNDIQITRAGGVLQEAIDTASQTAYGPRVLTKSGILLGSDGEALGLAQWLLPHYATPTLRIPQIVLTGDLAPATLWPQLLGREISDKITVLIRPPGTGTITKVARIEAIGHAISLDTWLTTWQLSLAGEDAYWVLDSATQSVLGSTTRLAF